MSAPIFPLLTAGNIRAFYTSRGKCIADRPYSGFNVCHYTGDDPAHIAECREELARQTGIPTERMVIPRQTHSTNVLTLTSLPLTDGQLENIDAIVTNLHDVIIGVNTADCVPVVLADQHAGIAGVAHAGWRGAVAGIVEATVLAMVRLGAEPSNIHAAMGPSICTECFEVGEEVTERFSDDCVVRLPGQKPHVSLHKHITNSLLRCGLAESNIMPFDIELCTRCHPDRFWSARKAGINSGRIFSFVIIGENNV